MTTILCIGDLHFCTRNALLVDEVIEKTLAYAKKLEPNLIIVMGDTLDTHEKIDMKMQVKSVRFFEKLKDIAHTIVLIGNHDRPNNSDFQSEFHPFYALKGKYDSLVIVDKAMSFNVACMKDNVEVPERIVCVPYVPPGRFMDALNTLKQKIDEERPRIIFAHQEFKGAKLGPMKSQQGDQWDEKLPIVISGHIHAYDKPQRNILYVGTPYQVTYKEDTDKALAVITLKDDGQLVINRHKLGVRMRKVIEINIDDFDKVKIPEDYDVKLIVKGDISKIAAMKKKIGHLPAKIALKPSLDTSQTYANKAFDQILFELIKNNPYAVTAYKTVFQT